MATYFDAQELRKRSSRSPQRGGLTILVLILGLPLLVPCGLIAAGGGAPVRLAYPVFVLAVAVKIVDRRRSLYPAYMIAVFAFAPFLRRLADYRSGFDVLNPILLAPYIGLLPTVPALLRRVTGPAGLLRHSFGAICGCTLYAMLLALLDGKTIAALFEAMKWVLPTGMCAFVMEEQADADSLKRAVLAALRLIVPILTAYGIYQYVVAPPWDTYWMRNIDNPTFGFPEPYEIRVFSMMNSPGTTAIYVSFGIALLMADGVASLFLALSSIPLLALTLIRTAWISSFVELAVLLAFGKPRVRYSIILGLGTLMMLSGALINSPIVPNEVRLIISQRIDTFADLQNDTSTVDRLRVYDAFFARLGDSPLGEGFGANASTATVRNGKTDLVSLDSGILETFLVFGVVGGTVYFGAFANFFLEAWRGLKRRGSLGAGEFAVICAAVAIVPLGSNHVAEPGLLLWMSIGLLISSTQASSQNRR